MKKLNLALVALLFISCACAAQDRDLASDAAVAAADAQRAATQAGLSETAEGLYRGCKASTEIRVGRPSEPDLILALDLASQCEAFASGVAAATAISNPYLVGSGCQLSSAIKARDFIDAIINVVRLDPLLIGQTTTQQSLTWEALRFLSKCPRHEG